jgi:hypothetical protein
MTHQEIEIPEDLAVLHQAVDDATTGMVTYLTREGQRVAAIVPVDLAGALASEPAGEDDLAWGDLILSVDESRRRFHQLAREQGVEPVTDPAELRGPGMDEEEFRAFYEAVTAGRGPG